MSKMKFIALSCEPEGHVKNARQKNITYQNLAKLNRLFSQVNL